MKFRAISGDAPALPEGSSEPLDLIRGTVAGALERKDAELLHLELELGVLLRARDRKRASALLFGRLERLRPFGGRKFRRAALRLASVLDHALETGDSRDLMFLVDALERRQRAGSR